MLKRTKPLKRTSSLNKTTSLKRSGSLKRTTSLRVTSSLKPGTHSLKINKPINKQSSKAKEAWQAARLKCLERDNYTCIICGKPATQVHHIHLRSKRRDLLYHLNNLVSLCDKCHFHQGSLKYKEQTEVIARKLNLTVEELLNYAEH